MDTSLARAHAAASMATGRLLLERAVTALGAHGLRCAPLKGVVLNAVAPDRGARFMADVDVLVGPHALDRAVRVLIGAGMSLRGRAVHATTLRDPALRMDLDVHGELFSPGLFRLRARDVLGRSRVDRTLFGMDVSLLDGCDFYCHLVGHFARSRSTREDRRRVQDLAVAASAFGLDEHRVATHMEACGLSRAARFVLEIAAADGDAFAARVLARLPRDAFGRVPVLLASRIVHRWPGNDWRSAVVPHLLNVSLPAGVRSFTGHALDAARRRVEPPTV